VHEYTVCSEYVLVQSATRTLRYQHDRATQAVEQDYFCLTPVFDDKQFERMYCITKTMAQQLLNVCALTDPFFTAQTDVCKRFNIGPMVKVLMSLKLIGYGCSPSAFLDYFQMGETTARTCLVKFCTIVSSHEDLRSVFARKMTKADALRVTAMHEEQHGIAGMIGSLDCTHVCWKNCPVAWQGSQTGKEGTPTIVLEACCDYNLWFWHASFGWPGSMNDINIWDRSCLLKSFLDGSFAQNLDFDFEIAGRIFRRLWVMVDGIYPELSRFVKTVEEPANPLAALFVKWQEAVRKDIERGFGVLKGKFHILTGKVEMWFVTEISSVVATCLMLHNMMVAHRLDNNEEESEDFYIANPHDDRAICDGGA
jgi:hypothetical protein